MPRLSQAAPATPAQTTAPAAASAGLEESAPATLGGGGHPVPAAASPEAFWARLVEALRRENLPLLAGALSRACPLEARPGLVRIGFAAEDRMAREQVVRAQREIEARLSRDLGAPSALAIESISAQLARGSLAAQERQEREEREARQKRACQDCEAVNLIQKVLEARIEHIDLFEAAEPDFALGEFAADDGQELQDP